MAIAHISVKVHSRAKGRSAVALAAYRSGSRFIDTRLGLVHNYARKAVDHSEILAPDGAPAWVFDRERLWNAVEAREKVHDAQVCREIELALPVELTREMQRLLVRTFIQDECVGLGMVADINIHMDNLENPHAHVLLSMRHLSNKGFGTKNRDWNQKPVLRRWRSEWEVACNRVLRRAGHEARIDCRSHADRGLDILPTTKIGLPKNPSLAARAAKRLRWVAERLSVHERVLSRNAAAIVDDSKVALALITYHEATFTRADVAKWLHTRVSDAAFAQCQDAVLQSPHIVALKDKFGAERFTTLEMLQTEKRMLALCDELDRRGSRGLQDTRALSDASLRAGLSDEQAAAVRYLVRETGDLAMLEGWAGAGKSRLLSVAREHWAATGHRVVGCALSGQAARVLAESAGLSEGRSIASLRYAWDRGRDKLSRGDVLVVDEAGLVGTRQMAMLLREASQAEAKVVLVGDGEQLQAIEAGGPFCAMARLVGKVEVRGIRRQEEAWMREASGQFAQGKTAEGLRPYLARGCVLQHETEAQTIAAVADAYLQHEASADTQSVLAYKREHVADLNAAIQAARRDVGRVAGRIAVTTDDGDLMLGIGDRVMMTKNHRGLGVQNGTLGTVTGSNFGHLQLRLDNGRSLTLELRKYSHLALGYAMTVHKSQGVTVQRTHVMASRAYDRHATYVAMTRHTKHVTLHFDRENFRDATMLQKLLSRERRKNLALDFDQVEEQALQLVPDVAALKADVGREIGTLAGKVAALQSRLRDIGTLLNERLPTLKAVVRELPELAPAREALAAAARRRDALRLTIEAQSQGWAHRLGLRRAMVRDPDTQSLVAPQEALASSAAAVEKAAAALEKAEQAPAILAKGQAQLTALRATRDALETERATLLEERDASHAQLHAATLKRTEIDRTLAREQGLERGLDIDF